MVYTLYHAPDDVHLVRPLARFIELSEVELVCVDKEPANYAPTGLVLCGRGYDTQPWLKQALRVSNSVVAVLLADVDPGVKDVRCIDLRTWPGRSADKTAMALAEWLKSGGKTTFPGKRPTARESTQTQRSQNIAAFVILAVIVGLFFMMTQLTDRQPEVLPSLGKPLQKNDDLTAARYTKPPVPDTGVEAANSTPSRSPPVSGPEAGVKNGGTRSSSTEERLVQTGNGSQALRREPTDGALPAVAATAGTSASSNSSNSNSPDMNRQKTDRPLENSPEKSSPVKNKKVSQIAGISRAELDRCYLADAYTRERGLASVPPRHCLILQASRRAQLRNPADSP